MLGVHGVQDRVQFVSSQSLVQCFTDEHAQILHPSTGDFRSCDFSPTPAASSWLGATAEHRGSSDSGSRLETSPSPLPAR